jgi:hypothetical protein
MAGAGWPPGRSGSPAPVVARHGRPGPVVAWSARPGPPGRPAWAAGPSVVGRRAVLARRPGRIAPRRHMAQRSVRSNVMLWMVLWSAVSTRRISLMRT